jgi:hypothetical protein
MIWLKCRFDLSKQAALNAAQNRFETLFMGSGAPPEMMMISEHPDVHTTIVWAHMSERWENAFQEFERGDSANLPRKASLLVGQPAEFERQFEYAAPR